MTPPTSLTKTLEELNALSRFFIDAEKQLKDGLSVDMSGMDERIGEICKIIQEAVPEQQEQYLPELNNLLNLLNSCESVLHSMPFDTDAE
ncbi:MAG: hypothetical protein EOM37_06925 [Proteobacteria bacterium]|jgi:hypothetical protein|nr:hypothetical protein [Alphaproteobacteria bacterium]NCC03761.1 hypothetical protein [Pseudomonadota bacterium]